MVTPEQLQKINQAVADAFQTLNANGIEMVYPSQANVDACNKFMRQEGISNIQFESAFVWQSALLECRKLGLLAERPPQKTDAEIRAELAARDAADGSPRAQAQARREQSLRSGKEDYKQAQAWAKETLEAIANPELRKQKQLDERSAAEAESVAQQQEIMETLPVEIPFSQFSREQRRMFTNLTAENIRRFNRKQAEYARTHQVEAD